MNLGIFKAYDVRGRYPEEINEGVVKKIAGVLARHFKRGKVVVARDARISSKPLYKAVLNGIVNHELGIRGPKRPFIIHNSKFHIHAVGLATTPMFYFLVNKLKAAGGIMITASHNPKEYNGLKVVGPKAQAMSGLDILKLLE